MTEQSEGNSVSVAQNGCDGQVAASVGSEGSAAFTPGPWVVKYKDFADRISPADDAAVCIADTGHWLGADRTEQHANARLIAAAPEMVQALKMLTLMARTSGGTPGPDPELMTACEQAEAAIAKAEGRS